MSENPNFFANQSSSTSFKVRLLQKYFSDYFGKVLMQYGQVAIIDPFAGKGEYEDGATGSPIAILEVLKNYLINEKTKKIIFSRHKRVGLNINFGDQSQTTIQTLKESIDRLGLDFFKTHYGIEDFIHYYTNGYENLIKDCKSVIENSNIPKFIFLDPFNFSIEITHLQYFMKYNSEVLLFVPFHQIHRFKDLDKQGKMPPSFKKFKEDFVGGDWASREEGVKAIINTLNSKVGAKFVRAVQLDSGKNGNNVYYLFFMSNHLHALHIMNDAVSSLDSRLVGYNPGAAEMDDGCIFGKDFLTKSGGVFTEAKEDLIKNLTKNAMNNVEVIQYFEYKGVPMKKPFIDEITALLKSLESSGKIQIVKLGDTKVGYKLGFLNVDKSPEFIFSPIN